MVRFLWSASGEPFRLRGVCEVSLRLGVRGLVAVGWMNPATDYETTPSRQNHTNNIGRGDSLSSLLDWGAERAGERAKWAWRSVSAGKCGVVRGLGSSLCSHPYSREDNMRADANNPNPTLSALTRHQPAEA